MGNRLGRGHTERSDNNYQHFLTYFRGPIYDTKAFDGILAVDDWMKLVAQKVTQQVKKSGDRYHKTVVFCVDREHPACRHYLR